MCCLASSKMPSWINGARGGSQGRQGWDLLCLFRYSCNFNWPWVTSPCVCCLELFGGMAQCKCKCMILLMAAVLNGLSLETEGTTWLCPTSAFGSPIVHMHMTSWPLAFYGNSYSSSSFLWHYIPDICLWGKPVWNPVCGWKSVQDEQSSTSLSLPFLHC